jgi:hypothetical protein
MKDGWGQRQDSIHIFNFSPLTGEGSELFGDFFNLADTLKSYFYSLVNGEKWMPLIRVCLASAESVRISVHPGLCFY